MASLDQVFQQAGNVLLGKNEVIRLATCCLLCDGHLLIEDVPGVGKTTLVHLLGRLFGIEVSRIQFTNDLLPSDIIGTSIFNPETRKFEFRKGPLFGHFILADEINRASPKTQSALLQVMEEKRINIDSQEFVFESPFNVMATQNPLGQIGTFPLPESQLDRFMMSLTMGFPEREFEKSIMKEQISREHVLAIEPVFNLEQMIEKQREVLKIEVSEKIYDYILDLLEHGRQNLTEGVTLSPRAGKDIVKAAQSYALLNDRSYVIPEDVQKVLPCVLGHRIGGSRGVLYGRKMVDEIIRQVPLR